MTEDKKTQEKRVMEILGKAKALAKEYHLLTGRPLGVTGEVAEYEAARILGIELASVRQSGYDAIRVDKLKKTRLQIKGRRVLDPSKPGQRVGRIDLSKEWDAALLVLVNDDFDAYEIIEASRSNIEEALRAPGSKARNERGALSVSKFKSIGKRIWP
jgi:hypothetical protein